MPETLRKVSSSLQDEMRERISTFETVLNVDQFLVRLLVSVGGGVGGCRVRGQSSASDLFGCLFTLVRPPQAHSQHSSAYFSLLEAPTWLN